MQYFEMVGHRAMYLDGWKAVTRHEFGTDFEADVWELYNLASDRSECINLAASLPDKVAELEALWWVEAEKFGALPLDDRAIELFGTRMREHSIHPPSRRYVYRPMPSMIPPAAGAGLGGRSWDLEAFVNREVNQGGVLLSSGNENAGLTVFVKDEHLWFDYNIFGEHHVVKSNASLPTGDIRLGVAFRRGKRDADATLTINGVEDATIHLPFMMRMMSTKGISVGRDIGSPVSLEYDGEFPFEGRFDRVEIQLISGSKKEEQETAAREGMARQ
jgi:arylsulfatase